MNTPLLSIASVVAFFTLTLNAIVLKADEHAERSFKCSIPIGHVVPNLSLPYVNSDESVILIRYLGFNCTHCVRQLTYLNSYAEQLRSNRIRVVAISSDDDRTNQRLVSRMGYDTTVFTFVSDPANRRAQILNLIQTVEGKELDLHAAMVIRHGRLAFGIYSTQPFMDIGRLVEAAIDRAHTTPVMLDGDASLAHYLTNPATVRRIAGPAEGIVQPIDLKFNSGLLHPNDLWVVTTQQVGSGMAIIHNAGSGNQVIRQKRDSRSSHFMYRTQALSFGTNGTFATAQSGWPGEGFPNYMFMGPTLWSSDTSIFASAYQTSNDRLASHLDMLHQSPWCLGIAHEKDNVYWVSDARYLDVVRYDYQDPHEVGGTDHRDGIVRRYTEASIAAGDRNRPAHMCLDKETGWLYYVDPGNARVQRLRVSSGSVVRQLQAPDESDEFMAEYSEVRGAQIQTAISGQVIEPVGLDIRDRNMIVGDRSTGRIYLYTISEDAPVLIGSVATNAAELLGITIGPDNHIWFVDRATATVNRLETSDPVYLQRVDDVVVADSAAGSSFAVKAVNTSASPVSFTIAASVGEGWLVSPADTVVTVEARGTFDIRFVSKPTGDARPSEVSITASISVGTAGIDGILPPSATTVLVVPEHLRRVSVNDGSTEGFDIDEAIEQTTRSGYVPMLSFVFNRIANRLPALETVLWYSGSFGDISVPDEAVLSSLRQRNIDVMLMADDPLALRAESAGINAFLQRFGCQYGGIDAPSSSDDGRRVYDGVAQDPVTNGLALLDCQLPRLDHHRGRNYVPSLYFRTAATGSQAMLVNRNTQRAGAVRFLSGEFRSIALGINPARFLDEQQRTTLLDNAIQWLEAGVTKPIDPDPVSVAEGSPSLDGVTISVSSTLVSASAFATVHSQSTSVQASVSLFSVGGQEMARLFSGVLDGPTIIPFDVSGFASGTYFLVVRTETSISHTTIVKQ